MMEFVKRHPWLAVALVCWLTVEAFAIHGCMATDSAFRSGVEEYQNQNWDKANAKFKVAAIRPPPIERESVSGRAQNEQRRALIKAALLLADLADCKRRQVDQCDGFSIANRALTFLHDHPVFRGDYPPRALQRDVRRLLPDMFAHVGSDLAQRDLRGLTVLTDLDPSPRVEKLLQTSIWPRLTSTEQAQLTQLAQDAYWKRIVGASHEDKEIAAELVKHIASDICSWRRASILPVAADLYPKTGGKFATDFGIGPPPRDLEATMPSELGFVVCLSYGPERVVETCPYTGGAVYTRKVADTIVEVRDARSGQTTIAKRFAGVAPGPCPPSFTVTISRSPSFSGSANNTKTGHAQTATVKAWLRQNVWYQ